MKRQIWISMLAGLLFSGVTCTVWAQSTAQINGSVRDQSGALLPGAEITVTQTDTGLTRNVLTNETGSYTLTSLPVGPYRLEATLPFDPQQFYPVCTGGKRPAPPEYVPDAWAYLELLDEHRSPPFEAILTLADMAQAMLDASAGMSIREAVGDLDAIREAQDRLETYDQFQPSAFKRRRMNAELRQQTWTGEKTL